MKFKEERNTTYDIPTRYIDNWLPDSRDAKDQNVTMEIIEKKETPGDIIQMNMKTWDTRNRNRITINMMEEESPQMINITKIKKIRGVKNINVTWKTKNRDAHEQRDSRQIKGKRKEKLKYLRTKRAVKETTQKKT